MFPTKSGDHPSIILVWDDVFYFWPLKGANQINMSKLDKRLIKNAFSTRWYSKVFLFLALAAPVRGQSN
jgi:hypothetical protein